MCVLLCVFTCLSLCCCLCLFVVCLSLCVSLLFVSGDIEWRREGIVHTSKSRSSSYLPSSCIAGAGSVTQGTQRQYDGARGNRMCVSITHSVYHDTHSNWSVITWHGGVVMWLVSHSLQGRVHWRICYHRKTIFLLFSRSLNLVVCVLVQQTSHYTKFVNST